jgi:hypothetical protein
VRLVVIGTIVAIVPFFTLILFKALVPLVSVFDSATCISTADDVAQIPVIQVSSSAMFLRWSETAREVPVRTLPVFKLMSPCFMITVECLVHHGCCVQHRLEALHVCVDFFIAFWQVG